MNVWRGANCSARGPGLSHTQNTAIRPDGSCIHCGSALTLFPPNGVPASASEVGITPVVFATVFDHLFTFSLTGRCARAQCGKPKDAHAVYLIGASPGQCLVDHRSIAPWSECHICKDVVEPKMNMPTSFDSYTDDKVWLTPSQTERLEAVHTAWLAGFYRS